MCRDSSLNSLLGNSPKPSTLTVKNSIVLDYDRETGQIQEIFARKALSLGHRHKITFDWNNNHHKYDPANEEKPDSYFIKFIFDQAIPGPMSTQNPARDSVADTLMHEISVRIMDQISDQARTEGLLHSVINRINVYSRAYVVECDGVKELIHLDKAYVITTG